jgi:uncharacterized protein YndB with AHSA1/START domain
MSTSRRQAMLQCPVEAVWELVGDPRRHPDWWPRVVAVQGESFREGDTYQQVSRPLRSEDVTDLRIERLEEPREIHMRCQSSGTYSRWRLTGTHDGTFIDVELGMDPTTLGDRIFDATAGRIFFRRWLDETLDSLRSAVEASPAPDR